MSVVNNVNEVLTPVVTHLPVADRTATATSSAVNIPNGFDGALVSVIYGTIGDGEWTPSLTESATSGGTYTAVNGADISGTPLVGDSDNDDQISTFYYHGDLPYIKVVMTESSASTTNVFATTVTPMKAIPTH